MTPEERALEQARTDLEHHQETLVRYLREYAGPDFDMSSYCELMEVILPRTLNLVIDSAKAVGARNV